MSAFSGKLNSVIAFALPVTLVCIPLTVGEIVYRPWIYGLFLCKTVGYLQGTCNMRAADS